jgi:hypothetical protein
MTKTHGPGAVAAIPVDAIAGEVAAYADDIIKAVAKEVLAETKRNAARAFENRSGRLYKSIKAEKSRYNDQTMLVKATSPQAHLIEYGHDVKVKKGGVVVGHVAARPFLGPAMDAVRDRLPDIINNVVGPLTIEVKQ